MRASGYAANTAFQIKLLLLGLAGLNVAFFHFYLLRSADNWDAPKLSAGIAAIPVSARLSGALSLLLWSGVMLAGRWIGHLI